MTKKPGKGNGTATWAKMLDASAPEDAPSPTAPTPKRGQRNKTAPADSNTAISTRETPDSGPSLPEPHVRPAPSKGKRSQLNVRVAVDLIDRIRDEVADYEDQGVLRTQGDIVSEALTYYYMKKAEEQQ